MAFGKKMNMKLRVQTERRDSRSYLLSPEMSRSPTQFAVSPTYSYVGEFGSLTSNGNRNKYIGMDNTWQASSMVSPVPLLPARSPCPGTFSENSILQNTFCGVGDLEHIHIDGMNQNKNYDYADYGHQYEELPNRKSIAKCPMDSGVDSRSELYQSSGGATDVGSEAEDTANIVNHRNEKRKRVNPLYDAMTQSMPSIYNKTKSSNDEALRHQIRCLKCTLIVFIVLTCAAIAVSVFALVSHDKTKDEPDALLTPRVQKLTEDFSKMEDLLRSFDDTNDTMKVLMDIMEKLNMLEKNTSIQIGSLNQRIGATQLNVKNNAEDIVHTQTNFSTAISFLNMTLQLQLHNISKQEGPQGPQGVANFSKCSYKNETEDTVASDVFDSYTPWLPTEIELERSIPLSAFCTVDGGTDFHLQVHAISPQKVQYKCVCSGMVTGKNRRLCVLHYLLCPRYS